MPGISFAGNRGGQTFAPFIQRYLLANSLTGTGTPPAAAIQAGDLVVLTTKSNLTSNSNVVMRQLLAADKTAHYKEGTPVAGILGVAAWAAQSNASGVATAPPPLGAISTNAAINYPLSQAGMQQADNASGRSYMAAEVFNAGAIFQGRLDTAAGAITLQHQYDDILAGFILTVVSGITTYTIDTGASASDQCIRIIGPNENDPLYNTLVAQNAAVGPSVFFQMLGSFSQYETGVPYSTQ